MHFNFRFSLCRALFIRSFRRHLTFWQLTQYRRLWPAFDLWNSFPQSTHVCVTRILDIAARAHLREQWSWDSALIKTSPQFLQTNLWPFLWAECQVFEHIESQNFRGLPVFLPLPMGFWQVLHFLRSIYAFGCPMSPPPYQNPWKTTHRLKSGIRPLKL